MSETTLVAGEDVGVFTRDQVEILSTRKTEPAWLREQRLAAQEVFATTPMPDTRPEEWRYTRIRDMLDLEALELAEDRPPAPAITDLPDALRSRMESCEWSARVAQIDASVVSREVSNDLAGTGIIFTSLEEAVREHPELVQKHLGSAVTSDIGKFAAQNSAFWTGGVFVYVPKNVKLELPLRSFRWLTNEGTAAFGRTLIVAEEFSEVTLVDEFGSDDFEKQTYSNGAVEVIAAEGARVHYISQQRWGRGVVHMTTDRLIADRDAKVTTLYVALGSDVTRADVQCVMRQPGSHVDMLGLYIAEDTQHFDHETLQDHQAPHASSNLLFKGALLDKGRSVFRGLIRVHEGAQRTDAYQTNRNLILSDEARADSLPNLEIAANDVRCSHAATIGQLDQEEIFYLRSRGIPMKEAMRLVIFGFFGEVLTQLDIAGGVVQEVVRAIEQKLHIER